jgi:hypothetical protein
LTGRAIYQTDTDICLDAIRTARVELSRFINPFESRDALEVLDRIIDLLDSEEVETIREFVGVEPPADRYEMRPVAAF